MRIADGRWTSAPVVAGKLRRTDERRRRRGFPVYPPSKRVFILRSGGPRTVEEGIEYLCLTDGLSWECLPRNYSRKLTVLVC